MKNVKRCIGEKLHTHGKRGVLVSDRGFAIKNIFDLKVIKIKLEKELLTVKNKVRSLEDEAKKPLNIHRWTKLECNKILLTIL